MAVSLLSAPAPAAAAGEVVVRLAGAAGVDQVGKLERALLGLTACRPPLVTLDLAELSHVSCLALGALTAFRRGIVRSGGTVRLAAGLQQPVREALERTGLFALFGPPEVAVAPEEGEVTP
jgi:anti-anti-sigma factor